MRVHWCINIAVSLMACSYAGWRGIRLEDAAILFVALVSGLTVWDAWRSTGRP